MKLHNRLLNILENKPATRNSDNILVIEVWASMGLHLTPQQEEQMKAMPSIESITRGRRNIQNKLGLYKASERIEKARMDKASTIRKNIARTAPDELEGLMEVPAEDVAEIVDELLFPPLKLPDIFDQIDTRREP